jgi:hypothetical protein
MTTTNIALYDISTNLALSGTLTNFKDQIFHAAEQNYETAQNGQTDTNTAAERRAIIMFETLRLTGGLGLSEILIRGDIIKSIEEEGLWTILPGVHANTAKAAAQEMGISSSEYSYIKDMVCTIFPYVTTTLGWNLADTWENIGKSNFKELVPVLKGVITGENSDSDQANAAVQAILNDVAATGQAAGQTLDTAQIRH